MNNKDGRISLNVDVLKAQRKQRGLSQEKVAEACMKQSLLVSVSSIKRAELGMNVLYRTATQLATFYGIPVELLITDNKSASSPRVLSGSHTQNKNTLTIVIETKNPIHRTKIDSLLDSSQKRCHQQGNYITIDWHISEDDTQVYKQIQCLCAKLKSTFQADIRLFIESTITEHNSEANFQPLFIHNKRPDRILDHSV
ncbi:helix-turn-helix protein [Marinomonas spartinae]|uniref:Helix-turn-helix protein n=1 Tax=Marinomonas spartinae TaxID=1792290 RepID=A0A1A8TUL8_9GAMM|nr:helix-turn-helix transcriptional regulator [Marinomonas spartinae]SBS29580.1 helix-turn-helix protein [Marinomonas spartinae]SBS36935.1 helix-turn-helix protein [Marinomonas spartinae]